MSSHGVYLSDAPPRRNGNVASSLSRKIHRACRTALEEPDLSLNLDIADYINSKQGAAPREAVLTIVKLINSQGTHTAIFALALLDVLVKNCGYPVHLQISRKEFLNALVKRFPERPPMAYTKVQCLILTAIEEWYQTLCKYSKYKEDMKYIRDMHSLLKYKGYVFPKIKQEDLAVLRPGDHLKTPSEIQKEQEIAQAAKLEELIRRGRPEDLREANKLMKIMAGFKEDNILQVKQTLTEELTKLKRKADLLSEMLATGDSSALDNDTVTELYSSLKSSQPKFQKIIEEDNSDDSMVQDILKFNDKVNQVVQQYQLLKKGKADDVTALHVPANSTSKNGEGTTLANEINLIDFSDTNNDEPSQNGAGDNFDDLLGELNTLNLSQPQTLGLGAISLGASTPSAPVETAVHHNTVDLLGDFSSSRLSSVTAASATAASAAAASVTPATDFDLLDGFANSYASDASAVKNSPDRLVVSQSQNLKLEFEISKIDASKIRVTSYFSNLSDLRLEDLSFLVAVPKSCSLNLLPQSDNTISPKTADGITQEGHIIVPEGFSKPLKVKWKVAYKMNGAPIEEGAIFTLPKI
ncbi:AaceriAER243Wp [[Ashbya] aceris (nom. inval.)]|nr:AaceriAER243Wp [[Ashbya] aceris (nom. inval.)]